MNCGTAKPGNANPTHLHQSAKTFLGLSFLLSKNAATPFLLASIPERRNGQDW
jgi:hypothetical protein